MTTSSTARPADLLVPVGGHDLAVRDIGPADGPVLLLCHPAPGSRLLDPDPAATAAAGIRLVTVDRPGYGRSVPYDVPRSVPELADLHAAVLDALGIDEVAAAGWSAGGRIAAALAARHPDRVRVVALLATPAPDQEVPWYGDAERGLVAGLRDVDPAEAARRTAAMMAAAGVAGAGAAVVSAGPADGSWSARQDVRAALERLVAGAFSQGTAGLAADVVSYTLMPWGFDPRAVTVPVRCWYGVGDPLVPPSHGHWWAAQVADGRAEGVPAVGHLVPFAVWPQVLRFSRGGGVPPR